MSDANFVTNAPSTPQRETLNPDGSAVGSAPTHVKSAAAAVKDARLGSSARPRGYGYLPIGNAASDQYAELLDGARARDPFLFDADTKYKMAVPVLSEDRRPRILGPGDSLARSLVRFTVWQDHDLAAKSKRADAN